MLDSQNVDGEQSSGFYQDLFHLPTFLTLAIVSVVIIWQVYDIGLSFKEDLLQLRSNRGNVILYWGQGCCQIDW